MSKLALDIARPTELDELELLSNIRQVDLDELTVAYRIPASEVIRWSCKLSNNAISIRMGRDLACIAGVNPVSMVTGLGAPWLIGTKALDANPAPVLVKLAPEILSIWKGSFSMLRNWVDDRNKKSIRWLKWMGFNVSEPENFGPYGMPFRMFEMEDK